MVEIHDLHASTQSQPVLHGIDLTLTPGSVHALIGPNGAGKSSLAAVLAGHPAWTIERGELRVDGENWRTFAPDERARAGWFWAMQQAVALPGVSTLTFLREMSNARRQARGEPPMPATEALQQARRLAQRVGLSEALLRRGVHDGLSGGESKRLELLQLLWLEPRWVVLDELDAGMDVDTLRQTIDVLHTLRDERRSFLIISHQTAWLQDLAVDRVHVMHQGRLVFQGGPECLATVQREGYRAWTERTDAS